MDNIFNTEQNEFFSNKQNAKILYLQNQNGQLQEDIEDLQKSLRLNKEALQLAYQQMAQVTAQQNQQQSMSKDQQGNNSTINNNNNNYQQNQIQDKQTQILLEKLMAENKQLASQNEKLRKERGIAYTKALIQEQISEESQSFQKEIVSEQDDKILELRRIIHDKEYAIQEFEKMHPEKFSDNTIIKTREIISPSDISMKLHQELESLRHIISRLTVENQSLNQKNTFLLDFNNNLKREILKLRVVLSNPVNYHKMKETVCQNEQVAQADNVELNKYFYSEYFKNEEEEQIARDFIGEQKYQDYIQKQEQLIKMNNKHEIQNQNYTMSRQQLFEKIDALEYIIENYRTLYGKETQNVLDLQGDISRLQRHNQEILDYNEILINSNKQHQERVIQQHREIELYKSYYYKYMEFIKNRRKNNLSQATTPINLNNLAKGLKAEHKFRFPLKQDIQQNDDNENSDLLNKGFQGIKKEVIKEKDNEESGKKENKTDGKLDDQIKQEEDDEENDQNANIVAAVSEQQEEEDDNVVNVSILDDDGNDNSEQDNQVNDQIITQQVYEQQQQQMMLSKQPSKVNNTNANNQQPQNNQANIQLINKQNKELSELQQQAEQMHEMNIVQCKKYLLNLAKELYINLSNNNSSKGITRQVLKRIQLGQDQPGTINLFRSKRSLSNPLDYTSSSFLEKVSKVQQQEANNNRNKNGNNSNKQINNNLLTPDQENLLPVINISPSAYIQQQQQQINNNITQQQQLQAQQILMQQQQQMYNNTQSNMYNKGGQYEEEYQQQMYTQQCNYDYDERKQKVLTIQKAPNQEAQFQTLVTQMNNPNDDYSHIQIPPQTHKQPINSQQQPIRINMMKKKSPNMDFDKIDKIDVTNKGHRKKITIQQFNDVDCSFISNQDELNF